MKTYSNHRVAARSCLGLVLALAVWTPIYAQPTDGMDGRMTRAGKMMTDGRSEMMDRKMMKDCRQMMGRKQKMKEDMAAQNAALAQEVAAMKRAPDDKKMSLMADIITHLVEQKSAMDARKAKLEDEMMKHMMAHMKTGGESMSCPMMKDMKDMDKKPESDEKPEDAHKEHHE
jgi:hypothetical protein